MVAGIAITDRPLVIEHKPTSEPLRFPFSRSAANSAPCASTTCVYVSAVLEMWHANRAYLVVFASARMLRTINILIKGTPVW